MGVTKKQVEILVRELAKNPENKQVEKQLMAIMKRDPKKVEQTIRGLKPITKKMPGKPGAPKKKKKESSIRARDKHGKMPGKTRWYSHFVISGPGESPILSTW